MTIAFFGRSRIGIVVLMAALIGVLVACRTTAGDGATTGTGPDLVSGNETSLRGQLLVASPRMPLNPFSETVVLILAHDETGAVGLVVNRQVTDGTLGATLSGLGLEEHYTPEILQSDARLPLMSGGPVEQGMGFTLHSDDVILKDSETVAEGIVVSTDGALFERIAAGNGPEDVMLMLGYAGWDTGQLESELARGDWDVVEAEPRLIFDLPPDERWQAARGRVPVDL